MLVTFHSKHYYPITMFGDVAFQLLVGMGLEAKVPGVLEADDVPQALWQLQQWLLEQAAVIEAEPEPDDAAEPALDSLTQPDEPKVSLQQRAVPLVEMLQGAAKANYSVRWD